MSTKSINVLITTSKKREKYLDGILSALKEQTLSPNEIYIIYDGALKAGNKFQKNYPFSINWIDNKERISLTCLQNHIIKIMKKEFVILLNDDIILEKEYISELVRSMEEDQCIGIACGKILRMDRETIDSAGQFLDKNRKPQDRGYNQKDQGQYNNPEFIFGACAAAVLYRKSMLDDIAITPGEYFDNDYNMFYEDLDISWRANNFGWRTFYNPKAVVYHERGATAKSKKPKFKFLQRYNFTWLDRRLKTDLIKNRYMTIIKNDKIKCFLFDLPHIVLYELKLWCYCLLFEPQVVLETIKNMPLIIKAFKKRRLLAKKLKRLTCSH